MTDLAIIILIWVVKADLSLFLTNLSIRLRIRMGVVEAELHHPLPQQTVELSDHPKSPEDFATGEGAHGTHWIGGSMDPRTGLGPVN
jgi:hypothetical protein